MKHDVFMSEVTDRIFTKRKFSCWEITKHDVFVSEATERIFTQRLNCRFLSESVNQSWWRVENSIYISIVDLLSAFDIDLISTILIFLNVETSLDKEKNRSHTHIKSSISNKQINTQNIKQKKLWVSLRFVSLDDLFASMTFSEFATTTSDFASMTSNERARTSISVSLLQRHQKRMRSIRYIFAVNIIKRWIFYRQAIRKQWHEEKSRRTWINESLLHDQISSSSSQLFVSRRCVNILLYSQSLQSIRTRRLIRIRKVQIREVWSNTRLRNQYRSVSACSRNRSIRHTNNQIFSRTRFSFRLLWHIFVFVFLSSHVFRFHIYLFTSIAFALRLSTSLMISHAFTLQSINLFAMSID